jgi:hypothetical protein
MLDETVMLLALSGSKFECDAEYRQYWFWALFLSLQETVDTT